MHFFIIFYAVSRVYKIRIHHVYITYLDHFQYHKKDARNAVKHFLTHHETTINMHCQLHMLNKRIETAVIWNKSYPLNQGILKLCTVGKI